MKILSVSHVGNSINPIESGNSTTNYNGRTTDCPLKTVWQTTTSYHLGSGGSVTLEFRYIFNVNQGRIKIIEMLRGFEYHFQDTWHPNEYERKYH